MSRRHEQKHLLHNWSDCRYRDRPQIPRAVLRVGVPRGERSGLLIRTARKRFVTADEKLTAFLELERVTRAIIALPKCRIIRHNTLRTEVRLGTRALARP